MHLKLRFFLLALVPGIIAAQTREPANLERILQRLDVLEQQNRELMTEIHALREQIASAAARSRGALRPGAASAGARLWRSGSMSRNNGSATWPRTSVESEHHSAVELTGMVLFNSYLNGRYGGGAEYPTTAAAEAGAHFDGATLRQTIVGLKFQAPEHVAGAEVSGDAYVDLFGGSGDTLDQLVRLRIANSIFNGRTPP